MNAIGENVYRRSWADWGAAFGKRWPRPRLIVCISAHWLTAGWWLTAMDRPKTIHDFAGFPPELFAQHYPAQGSPAAAQLISQQVRQRQSAALGLDTGAWGLDHGCWSVLKPMFPEADIPVIQLSMDYSRAPQEHYALAQQLKPLRQCGVLIVGSGNIVHNLGHMQPHSTDRPAYDWAAEFDQVIADQVQQGRLDALQNFLNLGAVARMAHPTHEHYLPLLYAAGAAQAGEPVEFFNSHFQAGSVSMRSMVWG